MKAEFNTFYDYMKSYDTDDLKAIIEHGCVSGCAYGLIYYKDTCAFYDQFDDELHTKLGEWIDEIGENPSFITDQLGFAYGFKNALVWFVAEQYANEILQTQECEG
jgi:hypothetical protein